jgi:hypothetical protein
LVLHGGPLRTARKRTGDWLIQLTTREDSISLAVLAARCFNDIHR